MISRTLAMAVGVNDTGAFLVSWGLISGVAVVVAIESPLTCISLSL
jgi:hypothetical protein